MSPTRPADSAAPAVPVDPSGVHPQAGRTRRSFIRGVAVAGASTAAASALHAAGVADLVGDSAVAAGAPTPFSSFSAIAPSAADRLEVPEGFRADVLISWGDAFENTDGTRLTYGFNNDFLAFLQLDGRPDEGLLFVNHEDPAPFFQHGNGEPDERREDDGAQGPDPRGHADRCRCALQGREEQRTL